MIFAIKLNANVRNKTRLFQDNLNLKQWGFKIQWKEKIQTDWKIVEYFHYAWNKIAKPNISAGVLARLRIHKQTK